jgi:multiple sugar transport system permease protein
MEYVPFLRGTLNTLVIEVSVIVVGTFVSTLAAFSFAKLKLRGKTFWLLLLMSGMMVPYAALMMPQYRAFQALHWTNTPLPLIIPGLFGNISLMFFLIQYMKGIPSAFFEAAKIDGAGYFTQFIRIMVPLCKTAISAQIIFWFIGIWNDYFGPSIYLTRYESMTLQPMIARLNTEQSARNMPLIFAGSVLASIPMIVIYLSFEKYVIESLAISGVKG